VALFVSLLSECHSTRFAGVRTVVNVHARVVHHVTELCKLSGADCALQHLIHTVSLFIQLVGLVKHVPHRRIFLGLGGLVFHLLLDELHELIAHARVNDLSIARCFTVTSKLITQRSCRTNFDLVLSLN